MSVKDGEMVPKRRGAPRNLADVSAGSPFDYDSTYTAFAPSDGLADMRSRVERQPIMRPHTQRVTVLPDKHAPSDAAYDQRGSVVLPVVLKSGPNAAQRRAARNGFHW